jgi:hypothetical protein
MSLASASMRVATRANHGGAEESIPERKVESNSVLLAPGVEAVGPTTDAPEPDGGQACFRRAE